VPTSYILQMLHNKLIRPNLLAVN